MDMGSAWFRPQALSITNYVVSENFSLVVLPKHESIDPLLVTEYGKQELILKYVYFVTLFHLQKVNIFQI